MRYVTDSKSYYLRFLHERNYFMIFLKNLFKKDNVYKKVNYYSPDGYYKLCYPKGWVTEYNNDTSEFYNPNEKSTFRITYMKMERKSNPSKAMDTEEFIKMYLKDHDHAVEKAYPTKRTVYYTEEASEENHELIIYYWLTIQNNTLLNCNYTILKADKRTEKADREYLLVEDMINSIEILK